MAEIRISGTDTTTGQNKPFASGDTIENLNVPATLEETLVAGNTTGASDIVISSGQALVGDLELHLDATGGSIDITAPSSHSIYIGSDQGNFTSQNDNTVIDAGTEVLVGNSRGGNVTIGIPDGGNVVTIHNFNAPTIDVDRATIGETGNGLILVDRGGTMIGGLTGPPITLGPVYYDPNNGMLIRFGNSIFLDGDGVINTVNGRDATHPEEQILSTLGETSATRNLATIGPITNTPLVPGSVIIQVKLASSPTTFSTVTDDGAGSFPSGAVLPSGGTIDYSTGAMTGTTATLAGTSQVVAFSLMEDASGEPLTLRGGEGLGSGDGASVTLSSGDAGTTGDSGDVNLTIGTVTSGIPGTVKVNNLPLPSVLASVGSIDLTATGDTTLYTVPTGRSAKILSAIATPTSASAAAGDAVVSIGTNVTRDDIIPATTLTQLTDTTESFTINVGGISHIAAAGEIIRFEVDSGDTGTTLVATVELIGFLI